MVLKNEPLFDNCLIKTINSKNTFHVSHNEKEITEEKINKSLENSIADIYSNSDANTLEINTPYVDLANVDEIITSETNQVEQPCDITITNVEDVLKDDNNEELKEIDILVNLEDNLENKNDETFTLKKPSQVYYDLYKEAREKAKVAKKNAIIAYLEAKNIKKTYMINNLDENESDIDAEIDEVSESELDDL